MDRYEEERRKEKPRSERRFVAWDQRVGEGSALFGQDFFGSEMGGWDFLGSSEKRELSWKVKDRSKYNFWKEEQASWLPAMCWWTRSQSPNFDGFFFSWCR